MFGISPHTKDSSGPAASAVTGWRCLLFQLLTLDLAFSLPQSKFFIFFDLSISHSIPKIKTYWVCHLTLIRHSIRFLGPTSIIAGPDRDPGKNRERFRPPSAAPLDGSYTSNMLTVQETNPENPVDPVRMSSFSHKGEIRNSPTLAL